MPAPSSLTTAFPCIIDKYELYEHDPFIYTPDYEMEVLDLAEVYGYLAE